MLRNLLYIFLITSTGLLISLFFQLLPQKIPTYLLSAYTAAKQRYNTAIGNHKHAVLIDYSKPFFAKRLWLIDVATNKVLLNCGVSHARKSGWWYAHDISNTPDTEKSSVGAFVTEEAYFGKFGYSMRLKGLEQGINDNARKRAIVVHASPISWHVGWSAGCFQTLKKHNQQIVDTAQDGCFWLVYKKD